VCVRARACARAPARTRALRACMCVCEGLLGQHHVEMRGVRFYITMRAYELYPHPQAVMIQHALNTTLSCMIVLKPRKKKLKVEELQCWRLGLNQGPHSESHSASNEKVDAPRLAHWIRHSNSAVVYLTKLPDG
jgi:hypothetical protein